MQNYINSVIWNNEIIIKKSFPTNLELTGVAPVFKKIYSILTESYGSVSVLPTVSKVFEKFMQNQLNNFIRKFQPLFLYGYRKGYSTQFTLMSLSKNGKFVLIRKDVQLQC